MAAVERTRIVVTDANVLINLIHVEVLRLINAIPEGHLLAFQLLG
jgi:hypothetical protein